MNSFDKRRPYATSGQPPVRSGFGAPLVDCAQYREQFAKRYGLLMIAFSHEIGQIFSSFQEFESRFTGDTPRCANLFRAFNQLKALQNMETAGSASAYLLRHFTAEEIAEFGIGSEQGLNIVVLKEKVATANRAVADSLAQFHSLMQGHIANIDVELQVRLHVALGFGGTFVNKLNRLVVGVSESDIEILKISASAISQKMLQLAGLNSRDVAINISADNVFLEADSEFLALIIHNILSNARRSATEKGIEPRIDIGFYTNNGAGAFQFSDNGNGMSEDVMGKLNAGVQATTKTEDGVHGVGFGYCRHLAELMGGRLYIKESQIGIGSVIVLELKIAGAADV